MSLIPSESESFPESFRRKVGWHISQEPEDPNATDAVQRLVEVSPEAAPAAPPGTGKEQQIDQPSQANPAAEEQVEGPSQPVAVDEHLAESASETAPQAEEQVDIPPESAPPPMEAGVSAVPEVPVTERQLEDSSPPDRQAPEQPIDISEQTQDVALERLSPPAETPITPPTPTAAPPKPAVDPSTSQDMPFRLLPDPVVDESDPANTSSQSRDMQALMAHFLSAGVPISFGQPNTESPPSPIVSDPAGLVTFIGDMPVVEPAAPMSVPDEETPLAPPVVSDPAGLIASIGDLPFVKPAAPVPVPVPDEETPLASPVVSDPAGLITSFGDPPVMPAAPVPVPGEEAPLASPVVSDPTGLVALFDDLADAEPAAPVTSPNGQLIAAPADNTVSRAAALNDVVNAEVSGRTEQIPGPINDLEIAPPVESLGETDEIFTTVPVPMNIPSAVALSDVVGAEPPSPAREIPVPTKDTEVTPPAPASVPRSISVVGDCRVAKSAESLDRPNEHRTAMAVPVNSLSAVALTDVVRAEETEPTQEPHAPVKEAPASTQGAVAAMKEGPARKQASDAVAPTAPASNPPTSPDRQVPIETPVQAHQIMQMIAAAVQRGELDGRVVSDSNHAQSPESASRPAVAKPSSPPVAPRNSTQPVEQVRDLPSRTAAAASDESDGISKKAPAKIRIIPRRIKPRAQPETTPAQEIPVAPNNDSPNNGATAEPRSPRPTEFSSPRPTERSSPRPTEAPKLAAKPPQATVSLVEIDRNRDAIDRPEPISHRVAIPRREIVDSDFLMFSARERRNRWIGFGLSELAALVTLIFLGHFGFTHKFPDPTLKVLVFILLFVAVAAAVALPIAFLRNDPARWGKEQY